MLISGHSSLTQPLPLSQNIHLGSSWNVEIKLFLSEKMSNDWITFKRVQIQTMHRQTNADYEIFQILCVFWIYSKGLLCEANTRAHSREVGPAKTWNEVVSGQLGLSLENGGQLGHMEFTGRLLTGRLLTGRANGGTGGDGDGGRGVEGSRGWAKEGAEVWGWHITKWAVKKHPGKDHGWH